MFIILMRMIRILVLCFTVVSSTTIVSEDYTSNPSQMPHDNTASQESKPRLLCMVYHHHFPTLERYDPLMKLCCNGLHQRNSSQQACCKGVIIDSREQFCCGEDIFDADGDKDCCGRFTYRASNGVEICCDEVLHKRPSAKTSCCGTKALDTDRQICCLNIVHAKTNGTECCGSNVMDPAKEMCCSGVPTDVKLGGCVGNQRPSLDIPGGLDDIEYPSNGTSITSPQSTGEDVTKNVAMLVMGVILGVVFCCVFMLRKRFMNILKLYTRINGCNYLTCYTGTENNSLTSQSAKRTLLKEYVLGETNTSVDVESAPPCLVKNHEYFFNNVSDHFVDSETQTVEISNTNKKNVFGQPYTHRVLAVESNATVNIPNSESRMTLPLSELRKHPIDVHCCSFDNIPSIRHKMGIPDDIDLATPMVEYFLHGCTNLCDYAVVVLPFIGDPSQLRVWKFQSDEGLHAVPEKVEVPVKTKVNEHLDAYYAIDGNKVRIYTKSFSGFYCTISADRPVTMRAFVFGSYKKIEQPVAPRREVRLTLFIVDDIMKFQDYKQALISREDREGRVLKKEEVLSTPHTTRETPLKARDEIRATLYYDKILWIPVQMPGMNEPVFQDKKDTELHAILKTSEECERLRSAQGEPGIPTVSEWYLCQGGNAVESFACVLDVDVCRRESNPSDEMKKNRLVIDELKLRCEDRLPIEDENDTRAIQAIKEYFSSHSERLAITRQVIQERFMVSADSTEAMFAQLHRKLHPTGIIEAVADALKQNGLIGDLVNLQKSGCIPVHYLNHTVHQPTSVDPSDLAAHAEETEVLLGACASPPLRYSDNANYRGPVRRELMILPVSSIDLEQNDQESEEHELSVGNVRRELPSDVSTYHTNGCVPFNGIQEQGSGEHTDPKRLSTIDESIQDQTDSDGEE